MAKYKGKNVSLNKPRRIRKGETSYGKKKSVVYVMDGSKVKKVTFGDPNMRIKKNQKGRRSNFRARHNWMLMRYHQKSLPKLRRNWIKVLVKLCRY